MIEHDPRCKGWSMHYPDQCVSVMRMTYGFTRGRRVRLHRRLVELANRCEKSDDAFLLDRIERLLDDMAAITAERAA